MKFQRNARIFQGRLDAAPFASVLFLLVIFLMAGSLVYTPGVHLQLPTTSDLPGLDKPLVAVALDKNGQLYFENQWIQESELRVRLGQMAKTAKEPLTLLVRADKEATSEMLVHLTSLAREAGIPEAFLAALPRPFAEPQKP
jgi:biopolymer transport protein ExbD